MEQTSSQPQPQPYLNPKPNPTPISTHLHLQLQLKTLLPRKHPPGQNPWRWGVPHLLGLPQGSFLDPLPISKPPGPRQHEKGVGAAWSHSSFASPLPAVPEAVRNIGLDCQSVTSRGSLVTCPSGRYRTPLSSLPGLFSAPHTPLHCVQVPFV